MQFAMLYISNCFYQNDQTDELVQLQCTYSIDVGFFFWWHWLSPLKPRTSLPPLTLPSCSGKWYFAEASDSSLSFGVPAAKVQQHQQSLLFLHWLPSVKLCCLSRLSVKYVNIVSIIWWFLILNKHLVWNKLYSSNLGQKRSLIFYL